jgi:hypothetical protein|tara:strand:+ start:991 stop:1137 length:147 start_codon:yes stop_codon:yes gene_type:complete
MISFNICRLASSLGAFAASIFFSSANFFSLKFSNNSYRSCGIARERLS